MGGKVGEGRERKGGRKRRRERKGGRERRREREGGREKVKVHRKVNGYTPLSLTNSPLPNTHTYSGTSL